MPRLLVGLTLPLVLFAALSLSSPKSASAEPLYFHIVNSSPTVVLAVHASPSGTGLWTGDLLREEVVLPAEGGTIVFDDGLSGCFYDIWIETDNGDAFLRGIDLCAVDTIRVV